MITTPYKPTETHRTLYKKIKVLLNSDDGSYGKAAETLLPDLNKDAAKTLIWRFYKCNIVPRNNEIRVMLGLPRFMEYQETEIGTPCQLCGVVHDYDCTKQKPVPLEVETYNPDTHDIKRKRNGKPKRRPAQRAVIYKGTSIEKIIEDLAKLGHHVQKASE